MNGIFEHARVTISVPNFNFHGSWVIDAKKISYEIAVNGNITLHIIQEPLVRKVEETRTATTTTTTTIRRNPPRLKEEPTELQGPQPTSPIEPKAAASPMSPMETSQVTIRLPPENVEEGTPRRKRESKSDKSGVVVKKEDCSGKSNTNEDVGRLARGSAHEVCAPSSSTSRKWSVANGDDDQTMGTTEDNVGALEKKSAHKVSHSSSTSRKRVRTKRKVTMSSRNGSTTTNMSRAMSAKPADPKPALVAGSQAVPFDGYIRRAVLRGSASTQHRKRRTRVSRSACVGATRRYSRAVRVEEREVSHNPHRRRRRSKKEERGIPDEYDEDKYEDPDEGKTKRKRKVYLCSIEGCRAERQGKRVNGDHFGPSGYRCYLHGGNKRRRKEV